MPRSVLYVASCRASGCFDSHMGCRRADVPPYHDCSTRRDRPPGKHRPRLTPKLPMNGTFAHLRCNRYDQNAWPRMPLPGQICGWGRRFSATYAQGSARACKRPRRNCSWLTGGRQRCARSVRSRRTHPLASSRSTSYFQDRHPASAYPSGGRSPGALPASRSATGAPAGSLPMIGSSGDGSLWSASRKTSSISVWSTSRRSRK